MKDTSQRACACARRPPAQFSNFHVVPAPGMSQMLVLSKALCLVRSVVSVEFVVYHGFSAATLPPIALLVSMVFPWLVIQPQTVKSHL